MMEVGDRCIVWEKKGGSGGGCKRANGGSGGGYERANGGSGGGHKRVNGGSDGGYKRWWLWLQKG